MPGTKEQSIAMFVSQGVSEASATRALTAAEAIAENFRSVLIAFKESTILPPNEANFAIALAGWSISQMAIDLAKLLPAATAVMVKENSND